MASGWCFSPACATFRGEEVFGMEALEIVGRLTQVVSAYSPIKHIWVSCTILTSSCDVRYAIILLL